MADRHMTGAEFAKHPLVENIRNQPNIAVALDHAVGIDRNAAAFLSTVLKGIKRVIGAGRHIASFRSTNSEDAAFLMDRIEHGVTAFRKLVVYSPIRRRRIS